MRQRDLTRRRRGLLGVPVLVFGRVGLRKAITWYLPQAPSSARLAVMDRVVGRQGVVPCRFPKGRAAQAPRWARLRAALSRAGCK